MSNQITDDQIREFRAEALAAGDTEAVATCDAALPQPEGRTRAKRGSGGAKAARARVAGWIADAAAQKPKE